LKNRYFFKSIIWIYYIFRFIFSILHIIELISLVSFFIIKFSLNFHFYCNNIYANAIRYIAIGYGYIYIHIHIQNPLNEIGAGIGNMEEIKENKKILYYFVIFAIVNELLIIKKRRVSPAYCLKQ